MYEALQYAQDLLIQFGGHTMAAGFSVRAENIEALRRRLLDYAAAHMTAADYVPLVHIDKELEPADVTLDLIAELSRLEPYGMGNSRPVFSLSGATVEEIRPIGREKQHVRLVDGADLDQWRAALDAAKTEPMLLDRVRLDGHELRALYARREGPAACLVAQELGWHIEENA